VRREAARDHGRILRTHLTSRGEKIYEEIDREIGELEEQMLRELSARDRDKFTTAAVSCIHMLGAGLPDV
jgi:DNA-binding MarR family transcriptional regulator